MATSPKHTNTIVRTGADTVANYAPVGVDHAGELVTDDTRAVAVTTRDAVGALEVTSLVTSRVRRESMTGTGWTSLPPAMGTTTTWTGGRLELRIPPAVTIQDACGASNPATRDADETYNVYARLQVVSGDGDPDAATSLAVGRDATHCLVAGLIGDGNVVVGAVDTIYSGDYVRVAGPSAPQRTGGELWLRLSRTPTSFAAYWGVGVAGALPTVWTCYYAGTQSAAMTVSQGAFTGLYANTYAAGVAAGWSIDYLALTNQWQSRPV